MSIPTALDLAHFRPAMDRLVNNIDDPVRDVNNLLYFFSVYYVITVRASAAFPRLVFPHYWRFRQCLAFYLELDGDLNGILDKE